ncbi:MULTISPECIES: type 1 glutamine amidotransferase domain-containing protein [Chryseobacterium]|uniref:type 1 glutamine amidotransferase domain-containing protein n=1 Tax=Chryseobacterium TaxID=59732 RepID=UPI0009D7A749|nr:MULTISPECIES: type 1 glutamine amidotransferase domain-containing protein [Chryseobacterium]MDC8099825.1 type 1 glutamine amidotransferase domain-containing protein [Chryseobacterium rhizosphaerae]SMC31411.1 Putative intracellular protease/amidase [Chryseobacterium sp. YR221]
MKKKVLIVVTSVEKYPDMDRATGLWLGEAVHFYEKLLEKGYDIDFVSPRGGYTPLDPISLQMFVQPSEWKFYADEVFRQKLATTLKPEEINPEEYSVIYYTGGHGVVWDFPENETLQQIAQKIYENGGIVSSVCHGAVGLFNIKLSNGELLINGKTLTGFSNSEEIASELADHMPYLTEDVLKTKGAHYVKADQDFVSFAVSDGKLVTGQNPQSGGAVAEKVLEILEK